MFMSRQIHNAVKIIQAVRKDDFHQFHCSLLLLCGEGHSGCLEENEVHAKGIILLHIEGILCQVLRDENFAFLYNHMCLAE